MTTGCSTRTMDSKPSSSAWRAKPIIQSGSAQTPARTGGRTANCMVIVSTVLHGTVLAPVEVQLPLGEAPAFGLAGVPVGVADGHDEHPSGPGRLVDVVGQADGVTGGTVTVE